MSWLQLQWDNVLEMCNYDSYNVRVYASFIVSTAVYWVFGAFFTFVDYTGKPKFMLKYRVQDNVKSYPV